MKKMINLFKRLCVLRYVCRKYNLSYAWGSLFNIKAGYAGYYIDSGVYHSLGISPFCKNFYDVLFHEIGHVVCKLPKHRGFFMGATKYLKDQKEVTEYINYFLAEEALASKFSIRVLKNKADRSYLEKCWHSYTRKYCKYLLHLDRADIVSKHIKVFQRTYD